MLFTAVEIALCSLVLRTTGEVAPNGLPVARQVAASDTEAMHTAVEINKKTKEHMKGVTFHDGEIDFTVPEKAFLLNCMARSFSVDDAEIYLTLKGKLSK